MLRRTVSLLALAFLALSLAGWVTPVQAQTSAGEILVLTVDGPIEPAMQLYIDRGLQLAADRQAGLVIIQLNTPGGSIDSMTNIYTAMRNSSVPVLVYVSPSGAMAASAGTLITLAGNLSAMAPQTTIGAASPVGAQGENVDTTEATKIKEIMKAAVRTFTQNRPPAATKAAEDAIDNATALNVDEALKIGLIDYKANDLNDLLAQVDGRKLTVQDHAITLQTRGITVQSVGQTIIEQGLVLFTD